MIDMQNNPHKKHRERMRDQLIKKSLSAFYDHQKLEMLLFYSIPVKDTNPLAHALLDRFGSLSGVFDADYQELRKVQGVGENTAVLIKLVQEMAAAYFDDKSSDGILLNTSKKIADFVRFKFLEKKTEEMLILCLDGKMKLVHQEFIAKGTVNATAINKRLIAEIALRHTAASVVLAHNHPSGLALPSKEDFQTSAVILKALKLLGINLIDSFVVASGDVVSICESPMFKKILDEI